MPALPDASFCRGACRSFAIMGLSIASGRRSYQSAFGFFPTQSFAIVLQSGLAPTGTCRLTCREWAVLTLRLLCLPGSCLYANLFVAVATSYVQRLKVFVRLLRIHEPFLRTPTRYRDVTDVLPTSLCGWQLCCLFLSSDFFPEWGP
jgi:hypothetical protein